ncbi:MAG: bifunctional DNA-formamidopyrimidine glycosylase/DNA-(apurinic or apyrimidinic site) lyase [Desulfobacca sp.]|uniref:bifunctional DNA-formamidopyrimidine glycosylase/DNA-(apurinic or apyrimidinic site) lyase n=1 Tax=Desulfobacca sp. TaxID=2067990 RepID=UPI00404AE693
MPELPEVEVIRRGLAKKLIGQTFREVQRNDKRLRRQSEAEALAGLVGRTVRRLTRRGKYLLIHLDDGQTLLVHLGMTGRLLLLPAACPLPPHVHLLLTCASGQRLAYQDVRRFGQVILYPAGVVPEELRQLGLEPWSRRLTPEWLAQQAANRTRPIKNLLLDGRLIAGIGNIYASEILFAVGLHPEQPAGQLSLSQWQALLQACRRILAQAIRAGGTTIANFSDCEGQAGLFAVQLQVYGRAGKPCPVCSTPIQRLVMAGRSTYWCPRCQPATPD